MSVPMIASRDDREMAASQMPASPEGPVPEGPVPEAPAPEGPVPEGPVPEGPVPECTARSGPARSGSGSGRGREVTEQAVVELAEVPERYGVADLGVAIVLRLVGRRGALVVDG